MRNDWCAAMQSTLWRHQSSKYYYSILSMMMMPKKGMVCFIVFFDNKTIWFGEKIKSRSQLWPFGIFRSKKILLRMTALHRPRYYYGALSMHNQKRNKLLSAKTSLPHDCRTTLILQTKILKKHRGPRQGDIFCPRVYSGAAFKRLMMGYFGMKRLKTTFYTQADITTCAYYKRHLLIPFHLG